MKRLFVSAAAMIVVVSAFAWAEVATPGTSHDQIVGTWKLESADHNGQPQAAGTTQIKMYTKSRYM